MAILPQTKRILREDVQEAPAWIDKIIGPINQFFETVYSAFNRNITFSENISCQIKEMTFTTSADYSSGDFEPVEFSSTLKRIASGLFLMRIYERQNFTPITDPVYVDWADINGVIQMNFVTGLEDETSYVIRVLVI